MSSRAFMILIAAIVVMIALFYTTPRDFETTEQELFLPGLKSEINDVKKITITGPGNEVVATLQRGETRWTIAERSGYAADVAKIRSNLIALANARIVEAKTADPALYDRIGVQDLDQPDASGTRIDIEGAAQPVSFIVGETGVRKNMAYVRAIDSGQSYLISADLDLGKKTADWLVRDIVNFSSADIHAVEIRHPDGHTLRVAKPSTEDTDFAVQDLPDGSELSYATVADAIGGVLTALTLEDVEPAADLDPGDGKPVVTRFEMFDGTIVEADAYQLDDATKVRFRVTAEQELANKFISADDSLPAEDVQDSGSDEEAPETGSQDDAADFSSVLSRAENLNAKLSPWVYILPSFKSDQLVKRMEDLLK